jgi:hypothetical protein
MKVYMNYTKHTILIFCIFLVNVGICQRTLNYWGETFVEHAVPYLKGDTIKYLKNINSYKPEKPTVVFLQGSLPIPLVLKFDDSTQIIFPLANFDCSDLLNNFNIILVSRPHTPLLMDVKDLTPNYLYVPDIESPNCFDMNYQKTNNLQYISERTSSLISRLVKTKQIVSKRILIIGHSQGAVEAARIAKINSCVTDVALLSTSPIGRVQDFLINNHIDYQNQRIDYAEYKRIQKELLDMYKEAQLSPSEVSCNGDSHANILSFSNSVIDDIINTKANVFYAFGTKDPSSVHSDLILLECIKAGKANCVLELYENCEHNFFEVNADGQVDYQKGNWGKVISDIIHWYKVIQ